jgi:DNA-directed RNA polymerase specialized sigma24 family protein
MSDAPYSAESAAPALRVLLESRGVEPAANTLRTVEDVAATLTRRQAEFCELVVPCEPRLLNYAQNLLKSRADAKDATQDAMLVAWTKDVVAVCGRDRTRILCYMMRVVFSKAMNMRREGSRFSQAVARLFEVVGLRKQRPAALLDRAIASVILDFTFGVLEEMDPEYAAAYNEVVLRGAPLKDAAQTLAVNINTLKARVRKARKEVLVRLASAGYYSDSDVAGEEKEDTP